MLIDSIQLLSRIGIECSHVNEDSRKLFYDLPDSKAKIIICRATDIPTFVEYGAADLGIVGKDTLLEDNKDVAELLDLKFGYCRFVVAMLEASVPPKLPNGEYDLSGLNHQRVATKFPRVDGELFLAGWACRSIPSNFMAILSLLRASAWRNDCGYCFHWKNAQGKSLGRGGSDTGSDVSLDR